MGAHSFQVTHAEKDPQRAYQALCQEALVEDGHSPYSGTIATTTGFRAPFADLLTPAHAQHLAISRLADLAKWGPCEAIAVGTAARTRTRTLTLSTPASPSLQDVAAAAGVPASSVVSYKVLSTSPVFDVTVTPPPARKRVWVVDGSFIRASAHATKREALRAARAALVEANRFSPADTQIRVFQQDDRASHTIVNGTLRNVRTRVEVQTSSGPLVFSHWLFYGWAAS